MGDKVVAADDVRNTGGSTKVKRNRNTYMKGRKQRGRWGRRGGVTHKIKGLEALGREDTGVESEGETRVTEVAVVIRVGVDLVLGRDTRVVGLMEENEGTCRVIKVMPRNFYVKKGVGSDQRKNAWKGKESGRRQGTKELGRMKGINKVNQTRHMCMCGRMDKCKDGASGRKGMAMMAAAIEQQEAAALTMIDASK